MLSSAPALVLLKRTLCKPTQSRSVVVAVVNPVKVAVSVPPPACAPVMLILMGGVAAGTYGPINTLARSNVPPVNVSVAVFESSKAKKSVTFPGMSFMAAESTTVAKGFVTEIVNPDSV